MFGAKNITKGLNAFCNWYGDRNPEEEKIIHSPSFQKLEAEYRRIEGTYEGKFVTRQMHEKMMAQWFPEGDEDDD